MYYGAKGIKVCDRWRDNFESFLADMGPRPSKGHSIGRIDPSKDYFSENCRWETNNQQALSKNPYKNKIKNILCRTCNKEFKPRRKISKFCSKKCTGISFSHLIKIFCKTCNKEVITNKSKNNKFCSNNCYWKSLIKDNTSLGATDVDKSVELFKEAILS